MYSRGGMGFCQNLSLDLRDYLILFHGGIGGGLRRGL